MLLHSQFQIEEINTNPLGLTRILRSVHGQGQHMKKCDVIDNELVYIPPSGQCLRDIIKHVFPDKIKEIDECFDLFILRHKI